MNRAAASDSVLTYRHQSGGGLKVYPATASPDSYVGPESTIEGESRVYSSHLGDSALKDTFANCAKVLRSTIADSSLADCAVLDSDLVRSDVAGNALVRSCRLADCRIHALNNQSPHVEGVKLSGVTVCGDAYLVGPWGLELEGAHVHAGVWLQQPRNTLIEGNGVHVAALECTEGRAHMGCTCATVAYWLERGPRLGRRKGWSEEMIEQCQQFLKTLR